MAPHVHLTGGYILLCSHSPHGSIHLDQSSRSLAISCSYSVDGRANNSSGFCSYQPERKSDAVGKASASAGIYTSTYSDGIVEAPSHATDEKIGVLLLNLGGPETLNDVQPFLFNLFADPVRP